MSKSRPDEEADTPFYIVSGIAKRWNCSDRHVRRKIASGELIAHRFGDLLRVSDADLKAYERQNREG